MRVWIMISIFSFAFQACGQKSTEQKTNVTTIKTEVKMDLSKITNENVKKAVEALQSNDKDAWFSRFADEVHFTDDGRTLDFKPFFDNAFNHEENFLEIQKVENNGKDIYGNFFAGQWGTFYVYFKFHEDANGKINRLDIGQVSKLAR